MSEFKLSCTLNTWVLLQQSKRIFLANFKNTFENVETSMETIQLQNKTKKQILKKFDNNL